MLATLQSYINTASNMGLRYTLFRLKYELLRKTGLLTKKFPINPIQVQFVDRESFKLMNTNYFFYDKEYVGMDKNPHEELRQAFEKIANNQYTFFSSLDYTIQLDDWLTHPETGYQFSIDQHAMNLNNLDEKAGDIKYIWERARFSYLNTIIRYDYHFGQDCSQIVLNHICSFIEHNPINQGPNYNCSQEISIRSFNWLMAIFYYRNSKNLTTERFDMIMNHLYWQCHHVFHNIQFSKIAVRNNHALTECLFLYIMSLLFPTMPNASEWKVKGKKWFEDEIAYQIYEDGTFLQFSMNYHRIVVQLLSVAIRLAHMNGERLEEKVYERAKKSVSFLNSCMNNENGFLPNYGNNDGALFFPLSSTDYQNYKPQLATLAALLEMPFYGTLSALEYENLCWIGLKKSDLKLSNYPDYHIFSYTNSGYYIIRDTDTITFIRCGKYKDRPVQADNLHVDIWVKGENILQDAGSYKYNTSAENLNYFNGTASHNTLQIGNYNQMKKAGRFIWNNWIREANATLIEIENTTVFEGYFIGYHEIGGIRHTRKIEKLKGVSEWIITDTINTNPTENPIIQHWHLNLDSKENIQLLTQNNVKVKEETSYISTYYGLKEPQHHLQYISQEKTLKTTLRYLS